MTQFSDWKDRAGAAHEEWAVEYWTELETHVRHLLADDQISDEAFVAVIKLCMPGGAHNDAESFARYTGIRQTELSNWIRGLNLPEPEVRAAYVHICLSTAGSKSLPDRVVKLLKGESLPDVFFGSDKEDSLSRQESSQTVSVPTFQPAVLHDARLYEIFSHKIDENDFSVRVQNCLKNEYIDYIGQLVTYTEAEMLDISMFGRMSLREVKEQLSFWGIRLGMNPEHYPDLGEFLKEHPPFRLPGQR